VIKPNGPRVLAKRISDETTPGGIILPDTRSMPVVKAEVVAVGDGWTDQNGQRHQVEFKVGSTIMYPQPACIEVSLGNNKYDIVMQDHVMLSMYEEEAK
jgi:chaperonin GroES